MRIFETTSVYSFDDQEWTEIYKINGESVDAETYFEEMEYEVDGDEDEDELEDEECECDGACENCDQNEEPDDSLEEENRLITECIDFVFGTDACIDCKIGKIIELAYKFKDIGWTDHQDYIREMNED